ncbi:MAG: excinuclease ABC subunit UvrB [Actinomycetota bacterium]
MPPFKVVSDFQPAGDQPAAIAALAEGIRRGDDFQTLLGVTGSGKTATIAWLVEAIQKPTLVISPNKSLAAQLANEFREFFPDAAVEYFVSYYDYYQPEAYVPQTDTFIEKDSSVNDEIDRLRHAATSALLQRRDVLIVASVSCIYGLGSPEEYQRQILRLAAGKETPLEFIKKQLVDMQYQRNDFSLTRGTFRVRGDTVEIHPAYEETVLRVEMFGDTVERMLTLDSLTGEVVGEVRDMTIYAASHYAASSERMQRATASIEEELAGQLALFEKQNKLLEAQRLRMRTAFDLEMMREMGFCSGIENYSRHIDGRAPGEAPYTLIDYFPKDFLCVVDESHVGVPQLNAMYAGDKSRKETLVEHGFRLPSAMDNRPLRFDEWLGKVGQVVFSSATPAAYELRVSKQIVEQVVRPTGLIDPEVIVRPTKGQVDDLIEEVRARAERSERTLVTTLTKKMAEDLTEYLVESGLRVRYMHSETDTIQRIELLRDLRLGEYDCLIGINLLREGLDLPEVSLVAILDADKEGFLRSETSLVQTIGRAARNVSGQVVMYADEVTDSMRRAINETGRRRMRQVEYNREHGIEPASIRKKVSDILLAAGLVSEPSAPYPTKKRKGAARDLTGLPSEELPRLIQALEEEMNEAARELRFEYAARLRDEIQELRRELREVG